jgi:hypothetical protein
VLLFLSARAADYITALLLYRYSEVFFVKHELNRSLVLALRTGYFVEFAVREILWFLMVLGGLRTSLLLSKRMRGLIWQVLVEVFSYAFLMSLGVSLCGVTANMMCMIYVFFGMRHPLEFGFRGWPPRLGEIVFPFLSGQMPYELRRLILGR